jgi:glucosamine--fructose-6-phosphate aminotransferase (isomerizing)
MYLIALKLARESEMSPQGGKAFIAELERIPDAMRTILENAQVVQKIAKKYSKMTHTLFLGRNIHLPSAQEAALKLKELTYREAGAYPMGELKHGPIAIIDAKSVSFIIMPKDELYDISKQSVEQIHSKGGKVVIITDESARDDHIVETADDVIFIPTLRNPLFYPLIEIIPLQLLALYMAESLGKNVDQPRNLAKSVTVE